MRIPGDICLAIAAVLDYPEDDFTGTLRASRSALHAFDPELGDALEPLSAFAAGRTLDDAQELYTATFDLSPVCTLDVGWHLFGESYSRGALLVGLRGELRERGVPETTELPDHLPQVLRLLASMPEGEDATLLQTEVVAPALGTMTQSIGTSANPYAVLIHGVAKAFGGCGRSRVRLPVMPEWQNHEESHHG